MLRHHRALIACLAGLVFSAASAGYAFDEAALSKAEYAARIGAKFVCENCDLSGADMSDMYILEGKVAGQTSRARTSRV